MSLTGQRCKKKKGSRVGIMLYRSSGQPLALSDEQYSVPVNFRSRLSGLQTYLALISSDFESG